MQSQVQEDLEKKMVLLAGPRQVGKTTLAESLPGAARGYLNWDIAEHREKILRRQMPNAKLWILDEIHKYRTWRNYLKGLYDGKRRNQKILVTGSARLGYYRHGGDSLQGRYHLLRLHPFTVAELGVDTLEDLIVLGGFPEPYLSGSEIEARRWSREYRTLLVREEVAGLEQILDLGNLELLAMQLPERVGSPLSINALSEEIQVSHKTIARWIVTLERLYSLFRLSPFGAPRMRAVKKAQKHYHLDWTLVDDEGARFENLVACHLLKWVHYQQDVEGRDIELAYFRDRDGREVDFVVTQKRVPTLLVECKRSDSSVGRGLHYLKNRYPRSEAWQLSLMGRKDYITPDGIRVAPAIALLSDLV